MILRSCSLLLALLLVWSGFLLHTAQGAEAEANQLYLTIACDEERVGQMSYSLYRVAESQEDGTFTPVEALENAPISFVLETTRQMQDCASTLDAYLVSQRAEGNPIAPIRTGETDENGELTFTDLPDGLYLLVGQWKEEGDSIYLSAPTLLVLPQKNEDGTANRQLNAQPKVEKYYDVALNSYMGQLTVEKRWEDGATKLAQPQAVTVVIYGDGVEYQRVTLNEENNWQYSWKNTTGCVCWQAMELDVPEGYTLTSVQDGLSLVITNTCVDDPETPAESDTPAPYSSDSNSPNPSQKSNSGSNVSTQAQKLPQTGQLQWPVPVLGSAGLCLILFGWGLWRRE
jgi:hypothetical protein